MAQNLNQIAIIVRDYDEAISYYTSKLGFLLIEDTRINESKRWVVIRPNGESSCNILLARAANEEQISRIGNQTGGRVFLFLYTDDINKDYQNLLENEVTIIRQLEEQPHGWVCVFQDIYGNLWDLIERKS